ncbi:MAG: hypothetical protein PHY92_01855 [Alphaproteobacteria bacterium]|nr:hypothetical protein [Alphaproteobacteria bacterium]
MAATSYLGDSNIERAITGAGIALQDFEKKVAAGEMTYGITKADLVSLLENLESLKEQGVRNVGYNPDYPIADQVYALQGNATELRKELTAEASPEHAEQKVLGSNKDRDFISVVYYEAMELAKIGIITGVLLRPDSLQAARNLALVVAAAKAERAARLNAAAGEKPLSGHQPAKHRDEEILPGVNISTAALLALVVSTRNAPSPSAASHPHDYHELKETAVHTVSPAPLTQETAIPDHPAPHGHKHLPEDEPAE